MKKREFGKTERKSELPWWKRLWLFLRSWQEMGEHSNFGGHHDRMQRRRRKTKFDK